MFKISVPPPHYAVFQLIFLQHFFRVGHCILFCLVCSVLFHSLKGTFRSFFEFLATYETQKNVPFFSVLFSRTEKNAKNATFFCKNRKEHKECNILLQRMEKNARTFHSFFNIYTEIYIDIYRHIHINIYRKKNGLFFLHSFFARFAMFV